VSTLVSQNNHILRRQSYLKDCRLILENMMPIEIAGRITRVTGLVMEASGIQLPIGSTCNIWISHDYAIEAEVIGFDGHQLFLMPHGQVEGVMPGARVTLIKAIIKPGPHHVDRSQNAPAGRMMPVGNVLLGRVVDASGKPLDNLGPIHATHFASLSAAPINPLKRAPIKHILDVGVRAINSMLTVGIGQRMGLFSGSGVGKSVLLGMIARTTSADVIVVGLIGERGREVKEFIEEILGETGLRRSVVVAAPADSPALMRLQGAHYATSIAEYFRDQGKNVLLIMDSLTRYAMAQREVALAVGEPPATKGYPPSVFAKLPSLVERTGNGEPGHGSITAFYTVLTEGDDQQDPIADAARAILDGHIVLSRNLAESGHYPAIDIEQSISRAMHVITTEEHQLLARNLKQLSSRYSRSMDLINIGAYQSGSDPLLDRAILLHESIDAFLQQGIHEESKVSDSLNALARLLKREAF